MRIAAVTDPSMARRALLGAAVAATCLAGFSVGAPPASAAPALARCTPSQLAVTVKVAGAAAGTVGYDLTVTDTSRSACLVQGHAGVSLVDAHGSQIGAPAVWMAGPAPWVTLSRGSSATALVLVSDYAVWPPQRCQARTASAVRVYVPDAYQPVYVPATVTVCSAVPDGLRTAAFRPGL